ncbi:DUF4268 domain-containing protein [Hoeflea sp.]|uniref:DUF4268 domain-containing protein n=1 Tax=Hoeflea sp. TaxID=1940281 RepID=UPI003B0121A6
MRPTAPVSKRRTLSRFKNYLDRYCGGGNATANICDFLDTDEIDELVLNPGNDQRIMFIAAQFRKEVTSTVLWLISHGISAQCFKVIPYKLGDELLIDVQQIIPTPEAEDFMIGMATKESEEKSAQGNLRRSHKLRLAFWEMALDTLREKGISRYNNVNPTKDHWLSSSTGISGCVYNLIFSKDGARVELSFQRGNKSENKWLFDQLKSRQEELESSFGEAFVWKRLDDRKSSRIQYAQAFDGFSQESRPEMIDWLANHIARFEETFSEPLSEMNQQLKSLLISS